MKLNFLAPAEQGWLTGRGRVISEGRRLVVAWGEALNASGRTVACGMGTFQRIPADR
jgi:acyl-coenzyme A thioesterase PaaI-like protein